MSTESATNTERYRRQLETIATHMTVAVVLLDERQQCVYVNPAAEELTGYHGSELESRSLRDVVHVPLLEVERQRGEAVLVHKAGRAVPVAFCATRLTEAEHAVGTLVELQDISHRKHAEAEVQERVRVAAFVGDVGMALTQGGTLKEALQQCTEAMVRHLEAAFARIWTLNDGEQVLELQASAGMYTHLDGAHGRVPVGQLKIGLIAKERVPHLTNTVIGDPRVGDQDWATREGMVSFAGYPLLVDGRVVGVMALFARHPLSQLTLDGMAAVANSVSLGIKRDQVERERNALLSRVERERSRLAELFEQAPAVVAVFAGPEHICRLANQRFRQLINGRDPLAKPIRDVLPELEGQGFFELLDQVYATGEPFVGSELPATIDRTGDGSGEPSYFNFVYQPIASDSLTPGGIFVHAVEVTSQVEARQRVEELADALRRQADELSAANRELEAFSYSVSHDLRAPLRAMDGFSRILLDEYGSGMPDDAQRYLQLVRDNAQQMGHLVDDLLAFSRLNRQELGRKDINVTALVHQVLGDLAPAQSSRPIDLRVAELPLASADPTLLRQVLLNLLDNALKFTRGREPAVIEVGALDQDGQTVYFVRDNGVGFNQRYAEKLFGVFQRLHRAEEYEGTGVGTAIVQRVVHRHGGRVWAESEVGKGAAFYFTLAGGPGI